MIQEHHVDSIRPQGTSQFVGETGLDTAVIGRPVHEDGQIIVAHGAEIALNLGAKQIDQVYTLEVGQYG